jgi:hypothetical protein
MQGPGSALSAYIRTENCIIKDAAIESDLINLINLSMTKSTWAMHASAWNALKKFENYCGTKFSWPLSIEVIRSFAVYCVSNMNLRQSTAESYLSSVRLAHTLQGLECVNFEPDRMLNLIYAGATTLHSSRLSTVDRRRAMSLPLLLLMAHRIQSSEWCQYSKQVVWAAATTAFFGSLRMRELLCPNPKYTHDMSCLKWKDVKFVSDNDILLRIPFTKTKKLEGEYVDIFSFGHYDCCPVASLGNLKNQAENQGKYSPLNPVFMFKSGVCLTPTVFNRLLRELFSDVVDQNVSTISMHSFRAGIPSAISAFPYKMYVSEVKEWGNWKGDSYLRYTRLPQSKKRCLFQKVSHVLLDSMK